MIFEKFDSCHLESTRWLVRLELQLIEIDSKIPIAEKELTTTTYATTTYTTNTTTVLQEIFAKPVYQENNYTYNNIRKPDNWLASFQCFNASKATLFLSMSMFFSQGMYWIYYYAIIFYIWTKCNWFQKAKLL